MCVFIWQIDGMIYRAVIFAQEEKSLTVGICSEFILNMDVLRCVYVSTLSAHRPLLSHYIILFVWGFVSLCTCKRGWDQLRWSSETFKVQQESETHPWHTQLTCWWLHDLRALPSRGWFYFPVFNSPSAQAWAPLRRRERETIFLTPEYIKQVQMSGLFFLSESGGWIREFDVSESTHWLLLFRHGLAMLII